MKDPFSRRALLKGLGTAPMALAGAQRRRPPNFLVILSDDQGYHDVGCYGSEIPTPHIDSIAANGVKFTNFYAAGPVCTPSRYGLLTGRYPARSQDKLLDALMPGTQKGIHPGETTVAEVLRERGYRTAIFGKWHLGYAQPEFLPTRHGFQQFDGFVHGCIDYFDFTYGGMKSWYRNESLYQPPRGYTTDYITDRAVEFLREHQRDPFFLYLPYNAPHYGKMKYDPATRKAQDGLQAPEEYIARFAHIKDQNRRVYAATVASLDDNIGRLLTSLRQLKLEDDTVIMFISDNGGSLPYGGSNVPLRGEKAGLFEGGIRVPCLMQWRGRVAPARTSRQPAGEVDVFSTISRLAGVEGAAPNIDGRDLTPLLLQNRTFERELFWTTRNTEAYLLGFWKYIKTSGGEEYLFDLDHDPTEKTSRIDDRAKLEELRRGYSRVKSTLAP
jgi:arylsulfatase A